MYYDRPKKLITIVGNGFDMAHGLPTSYMQFADWLIDKLLEDLIYAISEVEEINPLFRYSMEDFNLNLMQVNWKLKKVSSQTISNFEFIARYIASRDLEGLKMFIARNSDMYFSLFKSAFLSGLFANKYKHWFSIEDQYFESLYEISKGDNKELVKQKAEELNRDMAFLRYELINYLKTIEIEPSESVVNFIDSEFFAYSELVVLNFNYTDTINIDIQKSKYPKRIKNIAQFYHIHGSLQEGNVIFGYGNDKDDRYQEIKATGVEELLHFFKSFRYMYDGKYSRFIKDLDRRQPYDVAVLGHSLGQTDKTLLKEIFEHRNCRNIILYRRPDLSNNPEREYAEFRKLQYAISHIMPDEQVLRLKVSNYEEAKYFPLQAFE